MEAVVAAAAVLLRIFLPEIVQQRLATAHRTFGVRHGFPHSVQRPGAAGGKTGGNREFVPAMARAARAFGANGFFTSIGMAKLGIVMSLTRQVIFLLPLIIIFPLFMGIDGVMYAGPIADAAAFVLAIVFARRELGKMRSAEIV